MHGLAHAHENQRAESAVLRSALAPQVKKLLDDLATGEISHQPAARGGAEIAAHGAADLRGDATGSAIRAIRGHQHRLDCPAAIKSNQQLDRAVCAAMS